jgi:chaperonin GroES
MSKNKSILDEYTTPRLKPMPGYVLVEPVELEKKTVGGIVLPDIHDEKSQKGKIVALGDAIYREGQEITAGKLGIKLGDFVIYKKWGGDEIKFETFGKEHIFVKFEDILAVIK